jgi:hypothetical protein
MTTLVEDLLEFSRISSKGKPFIPSFCSPTMIAR